MPSFFSVFLPFFLLLQSQLQGAFATYETCPPDADNIGNQGNTRYTVVINVASTQVTVFLDTGSTDLWVEPPGGLASFHDTGVSGEIRFADGSVFVNGTIGLGAVDIAGHQIPTQAFLNVVQSVGFETDARNGIFGIIGLGFDSPSNSIPAALTKAGQDGKTVGKSVLTSIFDQNPDKGRFFTLSLSRLGDVADSADASLTISEYDPDFLDVQYAPVIPQFPPNSFEWTVLIDGIAVGNQSIPWNVGNTSVPLGHVPVLIDSGTTNFLVPSAIRDLIYSAVPGAVLAHNSSIPVPQFRADSDVWVVPCTTAVEFHVVVGGQSLLIHPLDLTDLNVVLGPDGVNHTICTGSVTNGGSIVNENRGALFGDSFLRNTHTLFNFGNATTGAYMQFLSQTDQGAFADFSSVRTTLLRTSAPELSPQDVIQLFDHRAAPASGATSGLGNGAQVALADNDSAGTSNTDSMVAKYGPVIIGLLGANLLILLILAVLAVVNYVRNGRQEGLTKELRPRYVPVRVRDNAPARYSEDVESKPYSDL